MKKFDFGIITVVMVASLMIGQLPGHAETYMGIGYNYTINDVRAIFPGATFEDQKVAWAKPGEKLICITGVGITGSIRILFQDARPSYPDNYKVYWTTIVRRKIEDRRMSADKPKLSPNAEKEVEELAVLASKKWAREFGAIQSDDKGYQAKWVRWIPNAPIPISRLKTKFGANPRISIDDTDFSIWAAWDSKGVAALLTDDKQLAHWVQYEFTPAEQRKGIELSVNRIINGVTGNSEAYEYLFNPAYDFLSNPPTDLTSESSVAE